MKTFVPRWEILEALSAEKLKDYQLDNGKIVEIQTDGNKFWYVDEDGENVYAVWG